MFAHWQQVTQRRLPREYHRIWSFKIHRIRPDIRIFEDAVSETGGDIEELAVQLFQTIAHATAGSPGKEVVVIVEPRISRHVRRPHIETQRRSARVHVEPGTTPMRRITLQR